MARKKKTAEELEEVLAPKPLAVRGGPGLSSGSTLVNLLCTGRTDAAYMPGMYYLLVGDSDSGKTFLCLNTFAEAANRPEFKDYRLVFDNPEKGAQMDLEAMFGKKLAARLEPPFRRKDGSWGYSERVEEFFMSVRDACRRGPCLYVLDSENALTSDEEAAKAEEVLSAVRKSHDKDAEYEAPKAMMTDGKAKKNNSFVRQVVPDLEKSGSILIVISQSREKIGVTFGSPATRAGGKGLSFFAQVELWSRCKERITKPVNGRPRHTGNLCQFRLQRSRFTGQREVVEVPIYFSSGLDDTGSLVQYLIDEKHWKGKGKDEDKVIAAPEFGYEGNAEGLVELVESECREGELKGLAASVWESVRARCEVRRKRRYE